MFRLKERTGLYTMAAEVTATYGGYYQPLRDWTEVYTDYIRRESMERGVATQYLADLEVLRIQSMSTDIALIAWTRSDFNVDILVGCANKNFYLLHNVQAFYYNGTLRVVGITGNRFDSPFMQVGGPHNTSFFTPEHTEVHYAQGGGDVHKIKVKENLHLDHELTKMRQRKAAANIVESIQSVIGCPTFL